MARRRTPAARRDAVPIAGSDRSSKPVSGLLSGQPMAQRHRLPTSMLVASAKQWPEPGLLMPVDSDTVAGAAPEWILADRYRLHVHVRLRGRSPRRGGKVRAGTSRVKEGRFSRKSQSNGALRALRDLRVKRLCASIRSRNRTSACRRRSARSGHTVHSSNTACCPCCSARWEPDRGIRRTGSRRPPPA